MSSTTTTDRDEPLRRAEEPAPSGDERATESETETDEPNPGDPGPPIPKPREPEDPRADPRIPPQKETPIPAA